MNLSDLFQIINIVNVYTHTKNERENKWKFKINYETEVTGFSEDPISFKTWSNHLNGPLSLISIQQGHEDTSCL